ncbi:4Fe-4S dicluster domain-containing protein [bacterium]|nr:MAG: 4Fe-4S dicluster domain-containing protein [bacterium]
MNKSSFNFSLLLNFTNMDFPEVNTAVCTGCGNCIDICPMEAITLVNEKAFIDPEKCSNCRLCENECPVEAIS